MRERDIFIEALQRESPADLAAYLDTACADDADLRARVQRLLDEHRKQESCILDSPPPALDATIAPPISAESAGSAIGPYKLIERIGEGGMGVVYLAEQTRPVRRQVALKLIKPGMDSRQVIARFEAERQALAVMDHPNIAKVLDAGEADSGRPFFVMELVNGVPITRYCDEHRLTPRQRLDLFVPVCQAVQHAHQKGIIHRDLKPSNVLVTLYDGRPVPKIIDFGIAKATGQPLTEATLVTGLGALVGTPQYMSPEQAQLNQLDVDTRSDVYALGVLLYELLTGTTPLDASRLKEAALLEVLRIIREEEPPKPSTRLSATDQLPSIAANRGIEPAKLSGTIRGELDWIVMKALEKERVRRYESAGALARDVERYLADEPVQACPPTAGYRLRKFIRRNKRAMTITCVLLLMLLGTAVSIGWTFRDRSARRAEDERKKLARQTEMNRDLDQALRDASLFRDLGDWPKTRDSLGRAGWTLTQGAAESGRERIRAIEAQIQLLTRLDALRHGDPQSGKFYAEPPRFSWSRRAKLDEQYTSLFAEHGIDVRKLTAAEAAALIASSPIRNHLVTAMDDWLWCRLASMHWNRDSRNTFVNNPQLAKPDEIAKMLAHLDKVHQTKVEGYNHLRSIADQASPNALSAQIRDLQLHANRDALAHFSMREDLDAAPPSAALLLGRVLFHASLTDRAMAVMYAAQQRSPGDFALNFELASMLSWNQEPVQKEEAIGFLRAAMAQRPQNASLHSALAEMLNRSGRLDQAIAGFRIAAELDATYLNQLASKLEQNGDQNAVIAVREQQLAANPKDPSLHFGLAITFAKAAKWDKAIASFREAHRLAPEARGYAGQLAWILANCPDTTRRNITESLAIARAAAALAEQMPAEPKADRNHMMESAYRALAAAQYRSGDPAAAILSFDVAAQHRNYPLLAHSSMFILAMAQHAQGDRSKAMETYRAAVEGGRIASLGNPKAEYDVLKAEAAAVLQIPVRPPLAGDQLDLERSIETASALILAGKTDEYHQYCSERIEQSASLTCLNIDGRMYQLLSRLCTLAPGGATRSKRLIDLAKLPMQFTEPAAIYQHTLGMAYYRAGQFDEALKQFELAGSDASWMGKATNWLAMAMTYHQLKNASEATRQYNLAVRAHADDRHVPAGARHMWGMHPHDWAAFTVLRREAEALLGPLPTTRPATTRLVTTRPATTRATQPATRYAPTPFRGRPHAVPGVVQFEAFDEGVAGIAYYELNTTPVRNTLRPTLVNIAPCPDVGEGHMIVPSTGEWLVYTVEVKEDGLYDIVIRYSTVWPNVTARIEFDNHDKTGEVLLPSTGGYTNYKTVTSKPVRLARGRRVMRVSFHIPTGRLVLLGHFNWIELRQSSR